jgi:hypothetical protein
VNLRKKLQDPSLLMRCGMEFLILASLANYFLHPATRFSQGATDGMKGLLYGISIGLLLLSVWRRGRKSSGDAI